MQFLHVRFAACQQVLSLPVLNETQAWHVCWTPSTCAHLAYRPRKARPRVTWAGAPCSAMDSMSAPGCVPPLGRRRSARFIACRRTVSEADDPRGRDRLPLSLLLGRHEWLSTCVDPCHAVPAGVVMDIPKHTK